jgi:putative endonuclease
MKCRESQVLRSKRELGTRGEKLARDFLRKKGYRLRETNYRCREGEIDIVAQHGDYLVFVEVRTRSSADFGSPEESVTAAKREKLVSLALRYLQTHQNSPPFWRIDVVAIELDQKGKVSRIELIENAVSK